jgi:outer membrane protein OmpA-like peptidoglycan-associated protein
MNRILLPVIILLWSLLYSWFWNCQRKPYCSTGDYNSDNSAIIAPIETNENANDKATATVEAVEEEKSLVEVEKLLFTPLDVYFETAKSGIIRTPEIENFYNTAKESLRANPEKKLSVIGHTDNDGTHATNDPLSVKRANILKDMLIKEGFSESQLIISGKGKREPIASNESAEGRAKNRRVTINIAE